MAKRILLGTADPVLAAAVPDALRAAGALVERVGDATDLWRALQKGSFDLIGVDRRMLEPAPVETMTQLLSTPDQPAVVILLATDEVIARAKFLAAGAFAVLSRETPAPELSHALHALAGRAATERMRSAQAFGPNSRPELASLETASPRMAQFLDVVRRVASSESSLLIQGETGVGKEYLAKAIHNTSPRSTEAFIPVHCAALTETLLESELFGHVQGAFTGATRYRRGYFELGHGGTVFLDEVGELSNALQVKLLRVLQERLVHPVGSEEGLEIDVRLMAATNKDLAEEVEQGRFRADLYYRLCVVTLEVPPLRERVEDIPTLSRRFVRESTEARRLGVTGIAPATLESMCSYPWPGNVRELMNVLERAILLADDADIQPRDLPFSAQHVPHGEAHEPESLGSGPREPFRVAREQSLARFEVAYLRGLLAETSGRVEAAARLADMNARTLYEKMRRHGLRKEEFRDAAGLIY